MKRARKNKYKNNPQATSPACLEVPRHQKLRRNPKSKKKPKARK